MSPSSTGVISPKGRQIAVTGAIRTGSYDAQDGTKRYTTDVAVESFEFIHLTIPPKMAYLHNLRVSYLQNHHLLVNYNYSHYYY